MANRKRTDWAVHENRRLIRERALEIGDGYRAKNSEFGEDGLPFARAGNVNGDFNFVDADILDSKSVAKAKEKVSRSEDSVITTKGTFGRVAFVRGDTPKFVYSPQLCYWRVLDPATIEPRFLYYWLQGPEFYSQAFQIKSSTDMADYASLRDQRDMRITLPTPATQRKIAAILSAYDELIENNKRRIALLEKMAEEIYREWFVRLRFPGHEKVRVRKGIPDGWEQKLLPEIANITYGFPFDGSRFNDEGRGMPIIRIRNIPASSTGDYTDEVTDEKYIVRSGDFLVGMDGEFHMNHWTGEGAYLVQRVCRIKAKDPELDGFLAQAVRAPIKHYESILLGATVGHLGAVHLKRISIMLPPEPLRPRLRIFNDLLKQKLSLAAATKNLARTRDLLLPRLISGKLSVENLDIQFPPGMMEEYENPPLSPLHKKGGSGGSEAECLVLK